MKLYRDINQITVDVYRMARYCMVQNCNNLLIAINALTTASSYEIVTSAVMYICTYIYLHRLARFAMMYFLCFHCWKGKITYVIRNPFLTFIVASCCSCIDMTYSHYHFEITKHLHCENVT